MEKCRKYPKKVFGSVDLLRIDHDFWVIRCIFTFFLKYGVYAHQKWNSKIEQQTVTSIFSLLFRNFLKVSTYVSNIIQNNFVHKNQYQPSLIFSIPGFSCIA
jgi:hypothetical protein